MTTNQIIEKVRSLADSFAAENGLFIVEVQLAAFHITVLADTIENITIEQCARLSRYIQGDLDESSDILQHYSFDVSSPGMSNPLKLPIQYTKRIGKNLHFVLDSGKEFEGKVLSVSEDMVLAEETIPAIKKSKEPEKIIKHELTYNQIKKATIPFQISKRLKSK